MLIALLPEMRGFARFLVRQPAEADDLVQEALVRALAALPQFQFGTNLRAWVFRILRNTFYEQSRRRRTEQAALAQSFQEDEARDGPQQGHMDLSDLQKGLFQLTPVLREALVLVGAQGLSQEDAAAVCGVPVGTMKARVSRARLQLAAIMHRPTTPEEEDASSG
jgi:RNA polymerase sigma-70 factor (ECF subfamily)